ncbi:DsrE/DsrF/TusD sulfur relay family protein [endosymbiont of Lamellibrachia barhami]|uniref:DsrE/DsrF/TusD sulfur relay family protein n=1 Tax=endosymbiont of Lamellibrachia barhami TaxID=205975 RepID=UPI0015ADE259|nr:DsrE family protein [endosymbiont of Lamellibrachia barhami]
MNTLIILNDPPYGTERSYNGLRLAKALSKADAKVTLFLLADAVVCAKRGQKVPQGFYNIELMLKSIIRKFVISHPFLATNWPECSRKALCPEMI